MRDEQPNEWLWNDLIVFCVVFRVTLYFFCHIQINSKSLTGRHKSLRVSCLKNFVPYKPLHDHQ